MTQDPQIVAALERGMDLFNQREFFEAHEVWEDVWRESEGEERHLLQGLIQVAAGFYKLQIGQPSGCFKLLVKGAGHLREIPADFYNVDLGALLERVDWFRDYAEKLLESFRTDYDESQLPSLSFRQQ